MRRGRRPTRRPRRAGPPPRDPGRPTPGRAGGPAPPARRPARPPARAAHARGPPEPTRRQRPAQPGGEDPSERRERQRPDGDPGDTIVRRPSGGGRPDRAYDADRLVLEPAGGEVEDAPRRRVEPLPVVDRKDHVPVRREP